MITALSFLLLLAMAGLVYGGYRIERLHGEIRELLDLQHAKCIAHITEFVGDQFAYQVLLAAAEAYDTPGEIARMRLLAQNRQRDDISVPAHWMMERGHILRSRVGEHDHE